MKNDIGIYIPSKGRGESAFFLKRLTKTESETNLTQFTVVVEPQDYQKYKSNFPYFNYLVLDKNDQGIAYARNFIKNHSLSKNEKGFWQIDDDIREFRQHVFGTLKSLKIESDYLKVLTKCSEILLKLPFLAIGGLDYGRYAASAAEKNKQMHLICSVDSVVFINNKYSEKLIYKKNTKEDRDIVLQALQVGYLTARITSYSFSHHENGSVKGGLQKEYASGAESKWVQTMLNHWPQYCSVIKKKSGRVDIKIDFDVFKKRFKAK